MAIIHSVISDFFFKGQRDYINFPTVFECFIGEMENLRQNVDDDLCIKNFKIHEPINRNSLIKVFDGLMLADGTHKKNLLAEMLCRVGARQYYVGFYDEDASSITKRINFPDKELVGPVHLESPFSGRCDQLNFNNHHELCQSFCTANKQLHLMSMPVSDQPYRIQAVFMSGYTVPSTAVIKQARLTIKNLAVTENVFFIFTFNQLVLNMNGQDVIFQLCYSIQKQ